MTVTTESKILSLRPVNPATGLRAYYPLNSLTTTVGRHPSNRIHIPVESVSRFHARIERQGADFVLTDLQSSNGTYVNGERIQSNTLAANQRIAFGNIEFRCELVDPKVESTGWPLETPVQLVGSDRKSSRQILKAEAGRREALIVARFADAPTRNASSRRQGRYRWEHRRRRGSEGDRQGEGIIQRLTSNDGAGGQIGFAVLTVVGLVVALAAVFLGAQTLAASSTVSWEYAGSGLPSTGIVRDVAFGDIDHDGRPELAAGFTNGPGLAIYGRDGSGIWFTTGLTGGPSGLTGIPKLALAGVVIASDRDFYYVVWGAALLLFLLAQNLAGKAQTLLEGLLAQVDAFGQKGLGRDGVRLADPKYALVRLRLQLVVASVKRWIERQVPAVHPLILARGAVADVGDGEEDGDALPGGRRGRDREVCDAQVRLAIGHRHQLAAHVVVLIFVCAPRLRPDHLRHLSGRYVQPSRPAGGDRRTRHSHDTDDA